ncbi:MAG: aspartyl-phosphate phosphatase Spo0E family protein [Niameybacter sp.]|uniref:aspartyl-phosphate phosphatase Spo0E family protein n=1 Tax=Niameybacter sp. TaxID=2033640 RepID=UPI002FCBE2B8
MNTTQGQIVDLQVCLNGLVEKSSAYTDDMNELYRVSQQLDELIVRYYREYSASASA